MMRTSGLSTDLYELTMAASFLRRGMTGPAVFSLFVRSLPPDWGFLVVAGLEDCLASLESYAFDDDDLEYLAGLGFRADDVDRFRRLRFTGDVWAIPEGRVVFADEPILEVTAPIAEAQLVETLLLNHVTYQTAIATTAARCRVASEDRIALVDFAFRRTHGLEAGLAVARLSAMVGFEATSNVFASRRLGLATVGTMAHSYIEAFPDEIEAFRAFAEDHPDRCTFLVDTYDTMSGVRNAIEVIRSLGLRENLAIRLDSGDLVELSRQARRVLDDAGLPGVKIFASGGLDEYQIAQLVTTGAPVDGVGVGTRMGVAADAPFLDSAYKLVEFGGRPVVKLSPGKATLAGSKQVYRGHGNDVLALRSEAPSDGEPLLEPVMVGGRRVRGPASLDEIRARFDADVAGLPDAARRLENPDAPEVTASAALRDLTARACAAARDQIVRPPPRS